MSAALVAFKWNPELVICFTLEPLSFTSLWTGLSVNVISKHDFTDVRFIIEIF